MRPVNPAWFMERSGTYVGVLVPVVNIGDNPRQHCGRKSRIHRGRASPLHRNQFHFHRKQSFVGSQIMSNSMRSLCATLYDPHLFLNQIKYSCSRFSHRQRNDKLHTGWPLYLFSFNQYNRLCNLFDSEKKFVGKFSMMRKLFQTSKHENHTHTQFTWSQRTLNKLELIRIRNEVKVLTNECRDARFTPLHSPLR